MSFVRSLTLPQLGAGAGYAIWAFRAIAIGHSDCPALLRGYERVFGDEYPHVLGALQVLVRTIGHCGGRRVSLAAPGCCGVTSDELSFIAMLSAAQQKDDDRRDAHLCWLTGGCEADAVRRAADSVGASFRLAGMTIDHPSVELKVAAPGRSFQSHHTPGNA